MPASLSIISSGNGSSWGWFTFSQIQKPRSVKAVTRCHCSPYVASAAFEARVLPSLIQYFWAPTICHVWCHAPGSEEWDRWTQMGMVFIFMEFTDLWGRQILLKHSHQISENKLCWVPREVQAFGLKSGDRGLCGMKEGFFREMKLELVLGGRVPKVKVEDWIWGRGGTWEHSRSKA